MRLARRLRPPAREPWAVLGPLALVQWSWVGVFALSVRYDGGPAVLTFLDVAVLLPIALLCVYGIAALLAGRFIGYWAAALWVAAPFAVIPLFDSRYEQRYVEVILPQALGLTGGDEFPAAVALLVAALFAVRALRGGAAVGAAIAGLAAGMAALIEPASLLFLPAPLLAFAAARRWRRIVPLALGIVPALVALALWRPVGFDSSLLELGDWGQLHYSSLRVDEYFWSVRPLEWAAVAGAVGVARRSPSVAVLLAVWFLTFLAFRAASPLYTVESTDFFRVLIPAYPAYVLLTAAIPLLVPAPGRLGDVLLGRETRTAGTRR